MADKNFKVKSGLQVPSLTTAGPVTTDSAGNVTSSATLPITQGGTGQTTAGNALNAFLPLQTSQDNKFLQTNGVTTQWTTPQQQTSTDGTLGYKVYSGTVTPSSPVIGDIWIDQTTGNGIQLVRWRKTIASTTTTLTGLDDNNLALSYTAGNEQVYINGTLITRGQDYAATNGTSVVLVQAAEVGDTVEIFGNPLFSVTDTYTQAQSNSLYVAKSGFDAAGKNKIINGDFGIWQRGTIFNNPGVNTYSSDRWFIAHSTAAPTSRTISRQTFTPGTAPVAGYEGTYFLRSELTTIGSSASVRVIQLIEDVRTFAGQTITISFWAKADDSRTISVLVVQNFGSGGSSQVVVTPQAVSATTSWTRFSLTFNLPSILGKTIGINSNLDIRFQHPNQNSTLDLWGVQVEAGSIATSFQTSTGTIAGELAACQRYFQRFGNSVAYEPFGVAHGIDVNNARMYLPLKVNMRTNPSFASSAASTFQKSFGTTSGLSTITLGSSSNHAVSIDFSRTSEFTANGGFIISSVAAGNAHIDLSAEI